MCVWCRVYHATSENILMEKKGTALIAISVLQIGYVIQGEESGNCNNHRRGD